jgi:hypothetical protein
MENVIKEAMEEASIPEQIAEEAKSVGAVCYTDVDEFGRLKRDILFCFDLELPKDFIPRPSDGEVQSFQLQDVDWVIEKIVSGGPDGFKSNINITLLDFLIR